MLFCLRGGEKSFFLGEHISRAEGNLREVRSDSRELWERGGDAFPGSCRGG